MNESLQEPGLKPLPEPMRIGQILDRGIRLFPRIVRATLPLYLGLSLVGLAQADTHGGWEKVGWAIVAGVLSFLVSIVLTIIISEEWLGGQATLREAARMVKPRLVARIILLALRIGLTVGGIVVLPVILMVLAGGPRELGLAFPLLMLAVVFIVLVYLLNRVLAFYSLIIEDSTISEALAKSKFLMTQGRWYSFNSPPWRLSILLLFTLAVGLAVGFLAAGVEGLKYAVGGYRYLFLSLQYVVVLITQLVTMLQYICYIGLYFDLRARYEGADLQADLASLYEGPRR